MQDPKLAVLVITILYILQIQDVQGLYLIMLSPVTVLLAVAWRCLAARNRQECMILVVSRPPKQQSDPEWAIKQVCYYCV